MALKANLNTAAKGMAQTKPRCNLHRRSMVFVAGTMAWQCPTPGCSRVAYPKHEDNGRPVLGKGDLELLIHKDEDGKTYHFLRATGNNVMIIIDDIMEDLWLADTETGYARSATFGVTVTQVTQLDDFGRRKKR